MNIYRLSHQINSNCCSQYSLLNALFNECLKQRLFYRVLSFSCTSLKDRNTKSENLYNGHVNKNFNVKMPRKSLKTKGGTEASYLRESNKHFIKIKRKDDADIFGTLSDQKPMWYPDLMEEPKEDNDLSDDSVMIKNLSKRYRCPQRYLKKMKNLVKDKKIKEALELFVDMRRNFVTPEHYHYTYMIGVCGRVGYTEMAFNLLRQMTDRSYQPTPATLTGLFNSCAESPFPEYGLKKAHLLKEKIGMKNWQLTQITYHAMIKAFGKCGDLKTAFQIADEMAKAEVKIDIVTYSFLLMSCIANKETGFTYAVEVWRKMKLRNCHPNTFTCNLMLRAARDCSVGPKEISSLLLQHWSSYSKRPYGFPTTKEMEKEQRLFLKNPEGDQDCSFQDKDTETVTVNDTIKDNSKIFTEKENIDTFLSHGYELVVENTKKSVVNNEPLPSIGLLAARPVNGPEIWDLVDIKTPSDKLSLFGGMEGFVKYMVEAKIKPSIKTLTLLLECLPPDTKEEDKLVRYIDLLSITPDIDFFNMLIKRRNFRRASEEARNVLVLINKYELTPDLVTFGVLSLGCHSINQAKIFLGEMKKQGMCPNIEIVGALMKNATFHSNFKYMRMILESMVSQKIQPNEKVLLMLENTLKKIRLNIISQEQGKEKEVFHSSAFKTEFKEFCAFYEEWLKNIEFEPEQHPWLQYKTDIIDRYQGEGVTKNESRNYSSI